MMACVLLARAQEEAGPQRFNCSRMVSFAPSITEILFELGLGSALAGVTRYDRYPPQAAALPRLGGLLDPNLEALTLLGPGLAIMLREHRNIAPKIAALGIQTLQLNHDSVSGILESIEIIGAACGKEVRAAELTAGLRTAIAGARERSRGHRRWRTLVVIGSNSARDFRDLFISGRDGFFSELLQIAGGENIYKGSTSGIMGLSAEGILELNPEVIIGIASSEREIGVDKERFFALWQAFPRIEAVREGRIYILDKDYVSVPGPRLNRVLDDIQGILLQAGKGKDE